MNGTALAHYSMAAPCAGGLFQLRHGQGLATHHTGAAGSFSMGGVLHVSFSSIHDDVALHRHIFTKTANQPSIIHDTVRNPPHTARVISARDRHTNRRQSRRHPSENHSL